MVALGMAGPHSSVSDKVSGSFLTCNIICTEAYMSLPKTCETEICSYLSYKLTLAYQGLY